ncbi:DUF58 domain-containing protein [Gilvimarinus sp. F26214L]|uniref:DUF58 domain-containing protein n=1 Tax=Gilvimarinus sp. DZF01 TaxID=3461371 RepID=UPI0040462DDB
MTSSANFIDPGVLASLDNLELRARIAVEGFLSGLHRSPHRGFSVEFTDYRHYNQGDDIRHIDWKLYGRSDKLYIKQFEDETNSRCTILLDSSASMSYGSAELSKLEYARTLAAALAYFVMRQKDAVGLITFSDKVNHVLPTRYRQGHLMQILRTLVELKAADKTDPVKPLSDLAANLRARSFVVLISDLLEGEEESIKLLQQMRAMGHEVIVFHVMDNAELNFPFQEASEFVDLETEATLLTSPGAIREDYLDAVAEYREYCRRQCQSHGVDYCLLNTSEPLDKALAAYLTRRGRTG